MRKIVTLLAGSVTLGALVLTAGSRAGATTTGTGGTAGNTGKAGSAGKKAPVHHFTFTRGHEGFAHNDSVGAFHAQVAVVRPFPGYPMPWSFTIGPKLRAIATGSAVCAAGGLNGSYHDTHTIPVGYVWHSTVRPHRAKKVYQLWGHCTFPVRVGGRPGVAHVGFTFNYAIDPTSSRRIEAPEEQQALETTVTITH